MFPSLPSFHSFLPPSLPPSFSALQMLRAPSELANLQSYLDFLLDSLIQVWRFQEVESGWASTGLS